MLLLCLLSLFFSCSSTSTPTKPDSESKLHYLALGDSYTIGESVLPENNFPHQLVKQANAEFNFDEPEIIATTGWRTDQLISKLGSTKLRYEKYDLITLLIGVNDEYQGRSVEQYEPQFRSILDKAIALTGDSSKVWVFSIPDYGYTPYGKSKQTSISKRIDAYNALNAKVAAEKGVHYLNITEISREGLKKPELIAEDGLHPSGTMYTRWIEAFFNEFKK